MGKRNSILVISLLVLLSFTESNGAIIFTHADPNELTVGDIIRLTVSVIVPSGTRVVPPEIAGDFRTLTVKEWDIKKDEKSQSDSLTFTYNLTTYIPEPCTIPSLKYLLFNGDKQDSLLSEAIPLRVISVITSDSAALKDIKPPLAAGKQPPIWLIPIFIAFAILVLIVCRKYLFKKQANTPPPPPPQPPYEEAIEALHRLEEKKYLIKGLVREYVFELSDIFKRYIARTFAINATEFTTEEMIAWLGASALDKKLRNPTEWFFRASDPVKFAKLIPDDSIIDQFLTTVRKFLEDTRPVIATDNQKPAATPAEAGSAATTAIPTTEEVK